MGNRWRQMLDATIGGRVANCDQMRLTRWLLIFVPEEPEEVTWTETSAKVLPSFRSAQETAYSVIQIQASWVEC